ncbi:MAG: hypothetical protein ABIT01_21085 [Thermoanaerobaculia bacterium]
MNAAILEATLREIEDLTTLDFDRNDHDTDCPSREERDGDFRKCVDADTGDGTQEQNDATVMERCTCTLGKLWSVNITARVALERAR